MGRFNITIKPIKQKAGVIRVSSVKGHNLNTCIQSLGQHYHNLGHTHRADELLMIRQKTTFI